MMDLRLTGRVAAAVTAMVLAAGCGGDGDGGGDSVTKAEFIQQADAICRKAHNVLDKAFNQAFAGKPQPSQAELSKFAREELAPTVQGEIDDVRNLDPPSGDESEIDAIADAAQSGVDKIKADPAVLSPQVKFDPLAENHRLARAYGMKECSE
jgi:hypothetical protein